jgi:hypothetical protein
VERGAERIADEVQSDYDRAVAEPDPEPSRVTHNLVSEFQAAVAPSLPQGDRFNIVSALNHKLGRILKTPKLIMFGKI